LIKAQVATQAIRQWALVAIIVIFGCVAAMAQDAHYNSQQPDAKGTLDGGTGTAGSRELSAFYYNPGVISLFDESNLGLSGSLYAIDFIRLNNDNVPMSGSFFQTMPSMLVGTFKLKNWERITSSFGYFNNGFYNGRITGFEAKNTVRDGQALTELYNYTIQTRYTSDWFGAGLSYRVSEKMGIGGVIYAQTVSKIYTQNTSVNAVDSDAALVYSWKDFRDYRGFSPGLVFNFGLVYSDGPHEWGMNIIPPRINVTPLAYSKLERTYQEQDLEGNITYSVLHDPSFLAYIKRPLEMNVGYAYKYRGRQLKLRLAYFSGIDPYKMGFSGENEFRTGIFNNADDFDFLPVEAINQVINIGLGYEWTLNDKVNLVSGFRTDFTYFDNQKFEYQDFTPTMVIWNIYRLSFGTNITHKWLRLNTGVDYGFSFDQDINHLVGFQNTYLPIDEIVKNSQTDVFYQQFKIFLGLILSFSR
jgi:hypothetical protein